MSLHTRGIQQCFTKLINIYVVAESLVFTVLQLFAKEKVKLEKKTTEAAFHKCSAKMKFREIKYN